MSSSNRPPFYRSGRTFGERGRNLNASWRQRQAPTPRQSAPPPKGELLAEIYPDDLTQSSSDGDTTRITNSEYLASYSWLSRKDSCILVPGEPPAWTPLIRPTQLREDSGVYFRDPSAARYPTYPLEPAMQAILTDRCEFPVGSVDIVACGSTFGNLLRFVRGVDQSFRMLIEVIYGTVFFMRRENSPTEIIPNVHGYGHAFPEAYTTWSADVKGSESHQRVMRYEFAGMDCLVRFQADGYLPDRLPKGVQDNRTKPSNDSAGPDPDGLLESMKKTAVFEPISGEGSVVGTTQSGKERKKKHEVDTLAEELPRLWIAQIPNFILAYHKAGIFNDIEVHDVRDALKEWEEAHQPVLAKFADLLWKIVTFAQCSEHGRLEIIRQEGKSVLELREQCRDAGRVLPPHIVAQWDDAANSGDDAAGRDSGSDVSPSDHPYSGQEDYYDCYDHGFHSAPDSDSPAGSDDSNAKDFTACSVSSCGYCGHCPY